MIYSVYYFESLPTVRTSSQIARDHTLTSTMPSYICKGLSVSVWRQVSSSTGRDKQHGTRSTSQSSINQLSKRNHHYATALSLFYSPMYYMAYLRVQVLGNTVFLNTLERFWIGNEAKKHYEAQQVSENLWHPKQCRILKLFQISLYCELILALTV